MVDYKGLFHLSSIKKKSVVLFGPNYSMFYCKNIQNNINRSLNILRINKIDISYCLLSNISALLSKSHFQSKTYLYVHKKLNI